MCCLTRRAHIPFPLCALLEGTHDDRVTGGQRDAIDFVTIAIPSLRSLRHAHRQVSFTYYVTRSPMKRTTLIGSLVLHPQGSHTQKTSELKYYFKDESAVFCVKGKRSTKAKSKQLAFLAIAAKSLVCDASLARGAIGALRLQLRICTYR